jgi:mannose-6-phosphate isomerase-like protein (cupin superfamily)
MPIIHAEKTFTHELPNARFTSLATPSRGSRETSVWRVELAPYVEPATHQLTREEVFVVLSGRARVRIGGEEAEAGAGDVIVVPPDTDFSLASATDQPLEALCCLPVGGQARMQGRVFTPPWAE